MRIIRKKAIKVHETDTLIGEGTIIEGKITSKASIRIDGSVKGDIICEGDVTVGEQGMVHTNITARNVYTAGMIQGSVTVKGLLNITSTGKVFGNIQTRSLIIAEGGSFQGTSKMSENKPEGKSENLNKINTSNAEESPQTRKAHLHKVEKEAANK